MEAPLVGAAQFRAAHTTLGERILKRLRIPRRDRFRNRATVIVAIQKRESAFARTESAVQMNPSPVARSIESSRGLAAPVERRILIPRVHEREQRCRGGVHVHLDMLRTSAARAPQVGRCNRIGGKCCGCSLAGTKAGCDYRIAPCDLQRVLI